MKNAIKFLSATAFVACAVAMVTVSCAKTEADIPQEPSTSRGSTDEGITVVDGALHFPSSEVFMQTIDYLSSPEGDLRQFEEAHGYRSLSTYTDKILASLDAIEDEQDRAYAVGDYDELLEYLGEGVIVPRIVARCYTNVANEKGVYYVGDYKYTITPEKLIAEEINPKTRSAGETFQFDYLNPMSDEMTRSVEDKRVSDDQYSTGKSKVFCRCAVIKIVIIGNGSSPLNQNKRCLKLTFQLQYHLSAQGKKPIIGWNSYSTAFWLQEITYELTYPSRWNYGQYHIFESNLKEKPLSYASEKDCRDWYPTIPFGDPDKSPTFEFSIDENAGYEAKWPGISVLRHRAISRGTSPCGAVHNFDNTSGFKSPLPQCHK